MLVGFALTPPPPIARPCGVALTPRCGSPHASGLLRRLRSPEVSLVAGGSLLLALVVNRLATEELLNSQSRADLIATVGPVLLMLDGLSNLAITPAEPEPVSLAGGVAVDWLDPVVSGDASRELAWATDALGAGLGASSVAIWRAGGGTLAARGLLTPRAAASPAAAVVPGPLLQKCAGSAAGAPEYLPALQLLPGRVEFSYFPEATQALLMVPLGGRSGVVVLGADRKRAFGAEDVAWARAIAGRLGAALEGGDAAE